MATSPRRGEIWLAQLPDDPKVRPVLIVSPDWRNDLATSVLAVPVTTNLRPLASHVSLSAGVAGLVHDSVARCENVQTVAKVRIVRGPLGARIAPTIMREVELGLLVAFGIMI